MRSWTEISPKDAVKEFGDLPDGARGADIELPRNEMDEECPWPWEPQQLVGAPFGQYRCGYCGAMCVAGLPHTDYTGVDFDC